MALSKSSDRTTEIPRLVTQPREHYLRQNEGRIRSLALPQNSSDEQIATHLAVVLMMDDMEDIHESAMNKWEHQGNLRFAEIHERHRDAAVQVRLYHLHQLANLLI